MSDYFERLPNPDDPSFDIDAIIAAIVDEADFTTELTEHEQAEAVIGASVSSLLKKHVDVIPFPDGLSRIPNFLYGEDRDTTALYADEEVDTLLRASRAISAYSELTHIEEEGRQQEFLLLAGEVIAGLEDRQQIEAWISVIRELFAPLIDADEAFGDSPEVSLLATVAQAELEIDQRRERDVYKALFRTLSYPIIDKFLEEHGRQHYDDAESLKTNTIWYLTLIATYGDRLRGEENMPFSAIESIFESMGIGAAATQQYLNDIYRDTLESDGLEEE